MWEKIKAWFKHSVTILWARIVMLAGVALAVFADPTVYHAVQQVIPPIFWPYVVIGFGAITELTRRRTAR